MAGKLGITYGIEAVQNVHPSHLGPLGYAWMTSASLGEAHKRLERFSRILEVASVP